jgi:probable addiction module antidote protein
MRPPTRAFDITEMMQDDQSIAEYLTLVMEDGDPALLAATLGDIARARGMTQIAKDAGIGREALYKALRPDASPRFDTVARVCKALGVKLVAQPVVN